MKTTLTLLAFFLLSSHAMAESMTGEELSQKCKVSISDMTIKKENNGVLKVVDTTPAASVPFQIQEVIKGRMLEGMMTDEDTGVNLSIQQIANVTILQISKDFSDEVNTAGDLSKGQSPNLLKRVELTNSKVREYRIECK